MMMTKAKEGSWIKREFISLINAQYQTPLSFKDSRVPVWVWSSQLASAIPSEISSPPSTEATLSP